MAKSYMTKFVEYVKTCKDNLKQNLIEKGSSANENDTLDSLVNKVATITPPPSPEEVSYKYVRDSALPNLDELFESDPLRKINGGDYDACAYVVMAAQLDAKPTISTKATSENPSKIIFGKSGRELSATSTGNVDIKPNEDEIYELTDGRRVYLLKIYANPTGSNYGAIASASNAYPIEIIEDDRSNTWTIPETLLEYARHFATNRVVLTSLMPANKPRANVVAEGFVGGSSLYFGKQTEYNCDLYATSSSVSLQNSNANYPIYKAIIPSVAQNSPAYGTVTLVTGELKCFANNSEMYIPNTYIRIAEGTSAVYRNIFTLHIPNSISTYGSNTDWFLGQSSYGFPSLRNLTISPNAFVLDATARTFYADKMPMLTKQSLDNLVEGLGDRTGKSANTVRFTKWHKAMLTDEQISSLQSKNWTVTFV
jgi:hypothetical protein